MKPIDPDLPARLPMVQRLSLSYATQDTRRYFLGLLLLDTRFAALVRNRRETILAQARIAWFRESLARPMDEWPQGEPTLDLLRSWRKPQDLAVLADGWERLTVDRLPAGAVEEFVAGRGAAFGTLAREVDLGHAAEAATQAAVIWAWADLNANVANPADRKHITEVLPTFLSIPTLPRSLRPLTVLAGLGLRAIRRGAGTPLLRGPVDGLVAMRLGILGR